MKSIIQMALKDIKLILRDKMGLFFIAIFPILMGLMFGVVMGDVGSNRGSGTMKVALVDEDQTEISRRFVESLQRNDQLSIDSVELAAAKESVRKGSRVGLIVIPQGFGETAGLFFGEPPVVKLGLDPSRSAEAAMLEGFVMQSMGDMVGQRFQDPQSFKPMLDQSREEVAADENLSIIQKTALNAFFNTIDSMVDSADELQQQSSGDQGPFADGIQFADVQSIDVFKDVDPNSIEAQVSKLKSRWDISFPQAMLWGVLGCVAGFAISIAQERSMGTLLRLQVAPVNKFSILAGKALACFTTVLGVILLMTVLGWALGLQLNGQNLPKLVAAGLAVAFCFVGIMMTMSVLGKTEQSVSGAGWAINMIMAMLGGCMIPAMFLPNILKQISVISPVRWAILSLEGAIWREYTWLELSFPCVVLIGFGTLGLILGVLMMARQED